LPPGQSSLCLIKFFSGYTTAAKTFPANHACLKALSKVDKENLTLYYSNLMSVFEQIKKIVKKIPKGKVTTYGMIARILGIKDARVVGWALHKNKNPQIPCYRVVNRFGHLASNYVFGGREKQKEKLKREGVKFINESQVNLKTNFWKPKNC